MFLIIAILGGYLLISGSLPIRGSKYVFFDLTSLNNIWARLSGLLIWIGLFQGVLPFEIPYGAVIFYVLALLVLVIAIMKELSTPVR
jgi:hypothetical protein